MNYSRIIKEASMRMMNPSVMVSRLDMVFLELAAAGIDFCRLPQGFWNFGVFIVQRGRAGGHRGGHNPPGHAWASRHALVSCAHLGLPLWYFFGPLDVFWSKKVHKSFTAFGLCLVFIFCELKNKQKIASGTRHYINRLVPKNDIKLLQNDCKTSKNDNIIAC